MTLASLLLSAGLVAGFSDTCCQENYNIVESCYAEALKAAGHHPVMIACNADTNSLREIVRRLDLVVLTGGKDIEPARYGEKTSPRCGKIDLRRDEFEFALCAAAVAEKKPIVGFCRGIQTMNVFFGGSLYQNLGTDYTPPKGTARCCHGRWPYLGGATNPPLHEVVIEPDSRLAAVIGEKPLKTNSHHHQGVKTLAPGFKVTARATDGFVEAIEHQSYPAAGFQFHPENTLAFRPQTGFELDRYLELFKRLDEVVGLKPIQKKAAKGAASTAPVAVWNFDEGGGSQTLSADGEYCGKLSPGMKWATGPFGTALAFTGRDSTVRFTSVSGLASPDALTISLRARWNRKGEGRYPSLAIGGGWMLGGWQFFVGDGALSFRARSKAATREESQEVALPLVAKIPSERWTHLAVTFARPNLIAYADGKEVARATFDHPFPFDGAFTLGSWGGACHDGFIDDLRLYGRAVTPREIARLANDDRYHEIEGYQDDGTGAVRPIELHGQELKPLTSFDSSLSVLTFDISGAVVSLKEKVSGRELVTNAVPLMTACLADGTRVSPVRAERVGADRLRLRFPAKLGEAELAVGTFAGGWLFTVTRATFARPVAQLRLFQVKPACDAYVGTFLNAFSDDESVVVLRGLERTTDSRATPAEGLFVVADAALGKLDGWRCALAAGPRARMRETLQAMTLAGGVPHSGAGGAWSMGSEGARRSYLFSYISTQNVEAWIDLAERGGFSILHMESWSEHLGHYPPRRQFFPNGLDDLKATVSKIHEAGLFAGIHTLTACISPRDSWITPVCNTNLFSFYTYTLARPLDEESTELVVNELPGPKHSLVHTYASNGNFIRLGNELVQYTGIRREKPYAFTGLKRGACGTKIGGPYPAGTPCEYVRNHYTAFYPKPDSPLADELADTLTATFNACDLDELYFDGSEGMATRYGTDAMRWKIFSRLNQKKGLTPLCEASCKNANNWWFQSRMGTVDHGVWAVKRFHDAHVRSSVRNRLADFLEPQMGWWQPREATDDAPGHRLDVMEYFASQNAGIDAAMSIQGVHPIPAPRLGVMNQFTVLGWYEHFRLARAFDPALVRAMAVPRAEFRLRQGDDGVWRSTPTETILHRAGHPATRAWRVRRAAASPAVARVTALYAAAPYDHKEGKALLSAADVKAMSVTTLGSATPTLSAKSDAEHGETIVLKSATKATGSPLDWVQVTKSFPFPYADYSGLKAFGLWVKGDGSGALLNLCVGTPPDYHSCFSDHFVRLDFTGWRYVELLARERDAEELERHQWPHSKAIYAAYRTKIDFKHLGSVSIFLEGVAPGKSAQVEISEVRALPVVPVTLSNVSLAVNGEAFKLPFAEMASGEYAELSEDGRWTRFDAFGEPIESVAEPKKLALKSGDNDFAFAAAGSNGTARLEATLFPLGASRPALVGLSSDQKRQLSYEAMLPFVWAPAKGLLAPLAIPVRPGEKAALEVEITGPIASPVLTLEGVDYPFDVTLAAGETLVCRDGRNWQVRAAKASWLALPPVVKRGTLVKPLPVLSESAILAVSAADEKNARARISLVKRYR